VSTRTQSGFALEADEGTLLRVLALVGLAVLTFAYLSVLESAASTAPGGVDILPVALGIVLVAVVFSRFVRERIAVVLAAVVFVVGLFGYLTAVTGSVAVVFGTTERLVADLIALLTGLKIVRIRQVDLWVLGFTPAPVFLSWYLALRKRYVLATLVGGAALGFLVLTGDAGARVTLFGALGGVAVIGFGEIDRYGGTIRQADVLAMVFAVMLAGGLVASAVFAGTGADPVVLPGGGGSGQPTLETSLTSSPGESQIYGSIQLSPEVRFTVTGSEPDYYRTGIYDRFTGDSWVRTKQSAPYDPALLDAPPGPTDRRQYLFEYEADLQILPGANQPVAVDGGITSVTQVSSQGSLLVSERVTEGTKVTVTSEVPQPTEEALRTAGTDYPEEIEREYTALPDSTSQAFRERTDEVVANAENPYEKAVVIERYLEETKEYNLNVSRPSGNVANEFLLEMDEGYCVYFATTMVSMLRSEGIPARYVTGYTSGQQVAEDKWVVRGLDSHAWVEVYFPDTGWVRFDPTPAGPRQAAERGAVEEARESGAENVDTDLSEDDPLTETPDATTTTAENGTDTNGTTPANPFTDPGATTTAGLQPGLPTDDGGGGGTTTAGNAGGLPQLPDPETVALSGIFFLGASAAAHRFGLTAWALRGLQLRWQGSHDTPDAAVERAYDRLELLLERQYRPRKEGETERQYLASLSMRGLDSRVDRVAGAYERARYGDGITDQEATEAVDVVDDLVGERTPILGRLRR